MRKSLVAGSRAWRTAGWVIVYSLAASRPLPAAIYSASSQQPAAIYSANRPLPAAIYSANRPLPAAIYSASTTQSVVVFGPQRYDRTRGRPDDQTVTVTVPAWVVGPYTLRVENGEPDHALHIHHDHTHRDHARHHDDDDEGDRRSRDDDDASRDHPHTHHYRVRSAIVEVNGQRVADARDFRRHTPGFDRGVVLTPKTILRVTVRGKPGSYVTITLLGTRGDNTPPQVTVQSPVPGAFLGTPTPAVTIGYRDAVGAGEPAASGLMVASFSMSIDGVDSTSLFTAGPAEATAALAEPLAEGVHTLEASITDVAGNVGLAAASFTVDLTAPGISVVDPPAGAFLSVATPTIRVTYQDAVGVDPTSFRAVVNGVDRTARFTTDAGSAAGTLDADSALVEGINNIAVSVSDRAGHVATATARATVDLTAPQIVIIQPRDRQYTSATTVDVSGGVVDASPVTVRVNDVDATLNGAEFLAANVSVGDGPEVPLRVVVIDAAGNTGESVVTLQVDRNAPTLAISSPAAGAYLKGPVVPITGTVSDETPLIVEVNGEHATVDVACAAHPVPCTFSGVVSSPDGALAIRVIARDAAGNQAAAGIGVTVDSVAPVLVVSEPGDGFISGASAVRVIGTVGDATSATVRVNGIETESAGGSFLRDVPAAEGPMTIAVSATDVAGNESTVEIAGVVDRTAPELEITAPPAGGIIGTDPVIVQGVVRDATDTVVTIDGVEAARTEVVWHAEQSGVADGSHTFAIVAADAAGNRTTTQLTATIDHSPPVVSIGTPAPGAITREPTTTVSGTVVDLSPVSVAVNGVPAALGGPDTPPGAAFGSSRTFSADNVPLAEGDNHIVVTATDATGRVGQAEVDLTRDTTPPMVEIEAPESVTRRRSGTLAATATDNLALASVVFTVNGMPLETFTAPPFQTPLTVPDGVVAGSTFVVMAAATDRAGNTSTASAAVRVAADGVVVGQTLDDATGLPLASATVTITPLGVVGVAAPDGGASVTSISGGATTTDDRGGYSLASADPSVIVAATKYGMTTVEREVTVQPEVGTVAIDARLTALTAPVAVGSAGGTLRASTGTFGTPNPPVAFGTSTDDSDTSGVPDTSTGEIVVTIPSGTLRADSALSLTPLSGQGLPNLLPLGWSPLVAFNLRCIDVTVPAHNVGGPMTLEVLLPAAGCRRSDLLPTASCLLPATVHLTRYDFDMHRWLIVEPDVAVTNGVVSSALPTLGAYALVFPDVSGDGAPLPATSCEMPAAGCELTGVEMVQLPLTATSEGYVSPAAVPPAGGVAHGVLTVTSPVTLPSGTTVQASVTETFRLASGDVASEEMRTHDLVLYRLPSASSLPPAVNDLQPAASSPQPAVNDLQPAASSPQPAVNNCQPPAAICQLFVTFPITPSRRFDLTELVAGGVHLDIYAGRERVRGQSGGSEPVSVSSGGALLTVSGGALPQDTAISLQPAVLSSFLPSAAMLQPLAEYVIDFSGRTLATPAVLSISISSLPAACCQQPASFLLARVVRPAAIPRLQVVALLGVEADRVVTRVVPGLPGVLAGGRYVIYRATEPVGFVAGATRTSAGPVSALVETASLPFVAIADANGVYMLAARAGAVEVSARVVGTSLAARGSVDVPAAIDVALLGNVAQASAPATGVPMSDVAQPFRPASLELLLVPASSTALVTPADGAVGMPATAQIELAIERPLDPATLSNARIRLVLVGSVSAGGPPTLPPVPEFAHPIRLVLSGSGRTLALVPLERLSAGAVYRVEASGLADTLGGPVLVPPTQFTTRLTETPIYNVDQLVFGFPDADGLVHFTGPAQTLPPGTRVLVVNTTTGEVASFTAQNDGAIDGMLAASLRDRLLVTITDPLGRVTTFERGEYVASDGRTAVNRGGGIVDGAGGAEIRIPQEALVEPLVISVKTVDVSELPPGPLPDLPDAKVSAALQIDVTAADPNAAGGVDLGQPFKRSVELAFPIPAGAPPDAVFRVLRRMAGPDGRVAYESIDYADVEGDGLQARVVTLSYPFSGYASNVNGYSLSGLDTTGAIGNQFTNHALVAWSHDAAAPGRAIGGVISGRVLRVKFAPGAAAPEFEPVARAIVSGVDAAGQPLFALRPEETGNTPTNIAVSQADGTFALFDPRYTGGPVTVSATVDGVTRTATVYESNPQDTTSPGLRFARHTATANITFPAVAPTAPPSQIEIRVMTEAENRRAFTNGVVIAGVPLVIGLRAHGADVKGVQITGTGFPPTEHALRIDPLRGLDPLALDVIVEPNFVPPQPGVYAVTATATRPDGSSMNATAAFRAVGPGGSNNDPLPNDPPVVITARTIPKANAAGVAVTVLPQVVFSEPVKRIPGNVMLVEADSSAPVAVALFGAGPGGAIDVFTADTAVTSLTLQPATGLKYSTRYTLRLTSGIVDLDEGGNGTTANKPLVPCETSFTTFAPQQVGATEEAFTAGGLAIVGDRAYVAQNMGRSTTLRVYDVSDPVVPAEIVGTGTGVGTQVAQPPPVGLAGNPVDLAVEEDSPVTGGRLLAVATNPLTYPYHPANVRLYDVTDDGMWQWRGVVTLGGDPIDGLIRRIVLRGELLYAVTAGVGKGIQVVDLASVRELFEQATTEGENSIAFWDMVRASSTEGAGFGQTAIVQTIQIDTGTGLNSQLAALGVMDLPVDGVTQPIVVATGRSPLVVANPQTGDVLYNGAIKFDPGDTQSSALTSWGFAIAVGALQGRPIAAVSSVGATGAPHVIAIVDLTDPRAPKALATLDVDGFATSVDDLVLRETTLYVGSDSGTLMVSLADPAQPRVIGMLDEIGGRLAFLDDRLVFGSARIPTETQHRLGGVRSAALGGPLVIIPAVRPVVSRLVSGTEPNGPAHEEFVHAVPLAARVIGASDSDILGATLNVFENGAARLEQALQVVAGKAATALAKGTRVARDAALAAVARVVTRDGEFSSVPRPIPFGSVALTVDADNDTIIDDQDDAAQRAGQAWAFWEADPANFAPVNIATVNQTSRPVYDPNALTDMATVRVTAKVPIRELRVHLRGTEPAIWMLTQKAGRERAYLETEAVAKQQLAYTAEPCRGDARVSIGMCTSTGTNPVVLSNLRAGVHEFLLSCTRCPKDPKRQLVLEYAETSSDVSVLDLANVDIRPLREWMTVYTAHQPGTRRPRAQLIPADGFGVVPANAESLTVLVHGFAVNEDTARKFTYPTMFKRLYWAKHPVLESQEDAQFVVGVAWPGDVGLPDLAYFPEDEFRAFQTGVPLARFLREQRATRTGGFNVVAHSLGNLVVTNALVQPGAPTVDDFVMIQSAVAAEAFDPAYQPSPNEIAALATAESGAEEAGYPADEIWEAQWQGILADKNVPRNERSCIETGDCRSLYDLWGEKIGPELDDETLGFRYTYRWRKAEFGNSPWRGVFSGSAQRARIHNLYSTEDQVLLTEPGIAKLRPWRSSQLLQKPHGSLTVSLQAGDDEILQYWGLLENTSVEERTLWDADSAMATPERDRLTRQWAELAYWFQPLSGPAGSDRVDVLESSGGNRSINAVASGLVTSHTYPTSSPVWVSRELYDEIRTRLGGSTLPPCEEATCQN